MSQKKRYHIHISLVRNENLYLENALEYALSKDYFLTWDLLATNTNFVEYSRQQIDQCDYMIFILGNDYGHLSLSGVSYLHLSYIYASSKRVPMIALVNTQLNQNELLRQRLDLFNLVIKEQGLRVIHFGQTHDGVSECVRMLGEIKEKFPRLGWVKDTRSLSTLPAAASGDLKSMFVSDRFHIRNGVQPALTDSSLEGTQQSPEAEARPTQVTPKELNEALLVNYTAHAFEGGNLQEISATYTFSWGNIVQTLQALPQPFTSNMMLTQINDSLKDAAMAEALKISPNIHAVSRCQISSIDYQWIKSQLVKKRWLFSVKEERSIRELWQINIIVQA